MVLRQATSDSQAKAAWKLLGAEAGLSWVCHGYARLLGCAGLSWVCHGYARLLGCLVIDEIIPTKKSPNRV